MVQTFGDAFTNFFDGKQFNQRFFFWKNEFRLVGRLARLVCSQSELNILCLWYKKTELVECAAVSIAWFVTMPVSYLFMNF